MVDVFVEGVWKLRLRVNDRQKENGFRSKLPRLKEAGETITNDRKWFNKIQWLVF